MRKSLFVIVGLAAVVLIAMPVDAASLYCVRSNGEMPEIRCFPTLRACRISASRRYADGECHRAAISLRGRFEHP